VKKAARRISTRRAAPVLHLPSFSLAGGQHGHDSGGQGGQQGPQHVVLFMAYLLFEFRSARRHATAKLRIVKQTVEVEP